MFVIHAGIAGAPAQHDGQHDFDYLLGSWKIHLKKMMHPLTGSTEWVEYDGTTVCRTVWDGRAELEEFSVYNREKNLHIEGLALRLYNPQSHQWSQNFVNSSSGVLSTPLIGSFKDGRGELFSQDTLDGRSILVRGVWSDIAPTSHRYQESYSEDGGKTWEIVFEANVTKANS